MATIDDVNSTLQNIARNLAAQVQSETNAVPYATASTSPVSRPFNNLAAATTTAILAVSTSRFGVIFHNPGATSIIYIYPSAMTGTPGTTALGGTFAIATGAYLRIPSTEFANCNCAWSAFAGTGSSQPFTVVEFLG